MKFFFILFLMPFFLFSSLSHAAAEDAILQPDPETVAINAAVTELAANYPAFPKATTQIVVNISVNRESKGDFFVERDDAGELYIRAEDIIALKLRGAEPRIVLIRNEKYVPLNAVPDIAYTFDEKNLTVSIMGKTTEKKRTVIELYPLQAKPQDVYYPHETSAFFNYGLTYSYNNPDGFLSFLASNKLGFRSGDVFFTSDSLYTKTKISEQYVRLQSSITYERRSDLQWLVFGDQFASSGDLGSSVNMGGIGFSKVYRLDPYLITQPVFDLTGVAAFPSEAYIYMDGALVNKQSISPGSFDLKNIYSYAGAHKLDVVLRDPFGNEQKISYPLYFNSQFLREGLHEYSYNVGFLREGFGLKSNDYGKPVLSAFHRYGVTNSFNIGARVEAADGITNGGGSLSFLVSRLGAFIMSIAGSTENGKKGVAGSFQHSFQLGSFSTNFLIRGFSRDYATVASPSSPDMNKYEFSAAAGYSMARLGSIGLSYSETAMYSGAKKQITALSYSRSLSRAASLFMSASTTHDANTAYSFFFGLNFNLDKNIHAAVLYTKTDHTDTETVQLQKDTPIGEGIGYRATLNRSKTDTTTAYSFNPFVQYNARYGTYSVDSLIQKTDSSTVTETYNLSAAGSLVYAEGFFGVTRPVSDSFSFVIVDKLPNATVLDNGQEIGKTDSSGTAIVPTLTSYYRNQITLDVKNLPMNYSIPIVNEKISPSLWSGSCVAFEAVKVHALTGTLFAIKDGKKIPMEFLDISMKAGERVLTFPTGKGGEFYIENSLPNEPGNDTVDKQSCRAIAERRKTGGNYIHPGTYPAWVSIEEGKCEFTVTFPETEDVITEIGEVQCVVTQDKI